MAIQAESADHDRIELSDHEVRQVEGSDLRLVDLRELPRTRVEFVAVRAREPLDAVLFEHGIQAPASSTIRIGDEDLVVAVLDLLQLGSHRLGDFPGRVVELGGQALDLDA